jgi:hypothetical protein
VIEFFVSRRESSVIAKQTKPLYFLLLVPIYALIYIVVAYGVNVVSHRFGWSSLMGVPFSFHRTRVAAFFWSIPMVAIHYWQLRKRERRGE